MSQLRPPTAMLKKLSHSRESHSAHEKSSDCIHGCCFQVAFSPRLFGLTIWSLFGKIPPLRPLFNKSFRPGPHDPLPKVAESI